MSFFPRVIENDVDTTTCRKRIDIDEYTRAAKSASFLLCTTLATRIFIPFNLYLRTFLLCPFFSFIRQRNYPAKSSVAAKRMKEAAARCKLMLFGRFIAYSFADFRRSWACYSRGTVEDALNKTNFVRTHLGWNNFLRCVTILDVGRNIAKQCALDGWWSDVKFRVKSRLVGRSSILLDTVAVVVTFGCSDSSAATRKPALDETKLFSNLSVLISDIAWWLERCSMLRHEQSSWTAAAG